MPRRPNVDDLESRQAGKLITRSIALPVQECLSGSWADFCRQLHNCWRHSTQLANWAAHEMVRRDVVRTPGLAKLPAYQHLDLYALAFGRQREGRPRREGRSPLPVVESQYDGAEFWEGAKIAAASLLRRVQQKYVRERGAVVWRRERRSPEYLYPVPFPVHQQAWLAYWDERHRPCVSIRLPGERVSLRLRGGPEFARQLHVFQRIVEGAIRVGELSLCRQGTGGSHRRTSAERRPGGGQRSSYRIMARIAVRLPVMASTAVRSALVRTGKDPFITLTIEDQPLWALHAPWVLHWIMAHRKFLDDFQDDLKYEKRWPGHRRQAMNRYRERRCEKHHRRMNSFLQETAAQVVGHACRQGVGKLVLDTSDRRFAPEFPWYQLEVCVQNKCDELGMTLETIASGEVVDEAPAPAREES